MAFSLPSTKSVGKLVAMLNIASQVLAFIAKLTKTTTDDKAVAALAAIRAAIGTAEAGFAGKVTREEVKKALGEVRKALTANDAAALARLRSKFGKV